MQQIIDIQADLQKICTLAELHLDENDSVFSFNQHFDSEKIACLCAVSSSQLAEIQQLNTYRLGIYYERLWRILIDNSDNFHCVLQNQQLIENKQTLGEFDFIIEDTQSHQFSHLEIAIKFYLNISHLLTHSTDVFCKLSAQENTWRGPNSSDSLATKYTHLINKQLKLSSLPAAQKLLATHKVQTPAPCFSLKGYLFNHWQHQGVKPAYYSGEVIEHHWLYVDELDDYLSQLMPPEKQHRDNIYFIQKFCWIRQQHREATPVNTADIKELLQNKDSPIMLALGEKESLNGTGLMREVQRFFVAPRCWPSNATLEEFNA